MFGLGNILKPRGYELHHLGYYEASTSEATGAFPKHNNTLERKNQKLKAGHYQKSYFTP